MNIFTTLAALLSSEITATLVIRKTAGGKMTVITNFNTEKGGVCDTLSPFTLKGTPEELDGGYLDAIAAPVETVNGLVSNLAAFQKSAQQAEKNAKAAAAKPSATVQNSQKSLEEAKRKAEAERKRKEAEAAARKENFDKALADAKKANAFGNYFTAEALLNLAAELTDDKKVKADIAKQVKAIAPNKEGFLCSDDAAAAAAAVETFKASMVRPQDDDESLSAQSAEEATDEDTPKDVDAMAEMDDEGSDNNE